ncbi:MAG: hypothetical protein CMF23_13345 [Ignavibacteriae bacterium]|nr:hypothetical protein [Ignavibacteriota bacterium]
MKNKLYILTAVLLGFIIFASNFLSADLFVAGVQNFTVWFVLSIFSFACGWLINKTLGWVFGGKIVFSVIVATTFITIIMISFFSKYFGLNDLLFENIILYSLRNVTLGAIAIFGMAIPETMRLHKELETLELKSANLIDKSKEAEKEAEIILNKAKLEAEQIIFDAKKKSSEIILNKNRIEKELKQFIRTERELIKQYEVNND